MKPLALALALILAPAGAHAQSFPSRLVRITAPYSSGAAPAIFTRLVADKLARAWAQQVIVDARPGASGFIAIEAAKGAPPDGHELLVVSNAHVAINPALYRGRLPYDAEKDFVPVALMYRTPFFVAVSASGRYADLPALVAAARARPGAISYGSSYVGSPSHLGGAELEFRTGTRMVHAPYKDQSQMYVAIANGDLDWAFSTLGSALPLLKAGRLRLLAIAALERSKSAPEIPTVAQAGGPADFEVEGWLGLVAPRGTPEEAVRRVNADVNRALGEPDVLERMRAFGFEPAPGTPAKMGELLRSDAKKYGEIVRRTGARPD